MIVGGAQENTWLTVRGLCERGHDVTLLTGPTRGPEGRLLQGRTPDRLRVVGESALIRSLNPYADGLAWCRLRRFFRRQQFDVVHTHSSKAGIVGRFAAWPCTPLVVHTVHGQPFHPWQSAWRNRLYIALEKAAAKRCHHICAVAQAMIDQCVAAEIAPADQYSVVYSGMELEPYLERPPDPGLRQRLGIPPDAPVVGKVARLFELKGHDRLIEAAGTIVEQLPEVRFLLVGDGILRPRLEAMVRERGLQDRFVFAGLVPPAAIPDYMGAIDILAHLSLREGLPRTAVQAFAAGKPVVALDLDGTPEVVIDGETGFLLAPEDRRGVADRLLRLLRNPQLREDMGRRGRELVRQRFDWQTMVDRLEELYISRLPKATVHGKKF